MRTLAIVVAAGSGARMGAGMPKALVPLAGRPMLVWCLEALAATPGVDGVVVVAPPGMEHEMEASVTDCERGRLAGVVAGGATRSRSVANGLAALPPTARRVLVQDAARPLLTPALVAAVLHALDGADGADGAIAAAPLADTLKRADADLHVAGTLDRDGLWTAQTPQAFQLVTLRAAFAAADEATLDAATDCASLVEAAGGRVVLVPSGGPNLKVTTPADLTLAEALLLARVRAWPGPSRR